MLYCVVDCWIVRGDYYFDFAQRGKIVSQGDVDAQRQPSLLAWFITDDIT